MESRTQGSRPRPRTQKKSEAKAKDSLSEDRTSRGQGQECSRPRTKDTGASVLKKKKGLQKFFSGDLQFIGYPEFLIGVSLALNCRGDASPHRDLASSQRDWSAGLSDEKGLILYQSLAKNRFNFPRRPFFFWSLPNFGEKTLQF